MVMYCQYNYLEVMYWYWYYIFRDVMSNVMQYFLKVMFKALVLRYKGIRTWGTYHMLCGF